MKKSPIRKLAVTAMLSAISIVLGTTPLGFIPIGPVKATIMHLPVIIGAIIEGPLVGLFVGAVFGGFSMYQAAFMPTSPVSVLFLNPLVSLLPRLLIGPAAYFVFAGFKKILPAKLSMLPAAFSAAAGTLTNTIGVLGMLYIVYAQEYVRLLGISDRSAAAVIWGIAATNALPETLAAIVIVVAVERALHHGARRLPAIKPAKSADDKTK